MNPQKRWLNLIRANEPTTFPFRLCKAQLSGAPGAWIPWDEWDWSETPLAQYRTLCQNEMCFDLDIKDNMELYLTGKMLEDKLEKLDMPYYVYDSGGKGYHVQVWLNVEGKEDDLNDVDWNAVRARVARDVLQGVVERRKNERGNWTWNVDPTKYNWDSQHLGGYWSSCGSVVRTVGGKKRSVKRLVKTIPEPHKRRRYSKPVWPKIKKFDMYDFPLEKLEKIKERPKRPSVLEDGPKDLPICIHNLIELQQSGVHLNHWQRIAMVAYMWRSYRTKKKERIPDYDVFHNIFGNDPDYDPKVTEYQLGYIIDKLEGGAPIMGCRYMKKHGIIDDGLCVLCQMTWGED